MFVTLRKKKLVCIALMAAAVLLSLKCLMLICARAAAPAGPEQQGIYVPIVLYNGIVPEGYPAGPADLTPGQLENDLRLLRELGYNTVFVNDLVCYVDYGVPLPEKPVVLSFEGGPLACRSVLQPLLEKYGMRASVSVCGRFTTDATESAEPPDPCSSCLSWRDIRAMRDSGRFEFCSLTDSMNALSPRRGVLRLESESYQSYRRAFLNDDQSMKKFCEQNCGFKPNVFVYPYGLSDRASRTLVNDCCYDASLLIGTGENLITQGEPSTLLGLERRCRPAMVSSEDFFAGLLPECEKD